MLIRNRYLKSVDMETVDSIDQEVQGINLIPSVQHKKLSSNPKSQDNCLAKEKVSYMIIILVLNIKLVEYIPI